MTSSSRAPSSTSTRRRADEAIALLDVVEATATDLLRRIAVTTTDGARAWAYHCDRPTAEMIRITVWDSLDER